jgi:hypothetical protein
MDIINKYISKNKNLECLQYCIDNDYINLGKILAFNFNKNTHDIKFQKKYQEIMNYEKDQYTVKMTSFWQNSKDECNMWNKQSKNNNYRWGKMTITSSDNADYTCVINAPYQNEKIIPEKTILFRMEPNMHLKSQLWGEWADPKHNFLKYCPHELEYNNNEWHLNKTYRQLKTEKIEKTIEKTLSTIQSTKYKDLGHIKRIKFLKYLEKKGGINLDIYGRCSSLNFKNYKGELPTHNRNKGILPYKYTFHAENNSIHNYYTEKIIDAILGECLIFYNGCPNINEYINENAYIWLDLEDFEKDYHIIKSAIENNEWEKRLPYIREAKNKILDSLQFFPRLEKIINDYRAKTIYKENENITK